MADKEWKDHKYIAKVPLKTSGKNKKYRYFYTRPAYQAYLNAKKKTEENEVVQKKVAEVNKSYYTDTRAKIADREPVKKIIKTAKNVASKVADNVEDTVKVVKKSTNKAATEIKEVVDKTVDNAVKTVKMVQDKSEERKEQREERKEQRAAEREERERLAAEIEKDENPDSFDDLDKKTDDTTNDEDQAAVNPNYDPRDYEYSHNCSYCTAAYDLRQRGYDVEARPKDPDHHTNADEILSWYEGAVLENGPLDTSDPIQATQDLEKELLTYGDGAYGHLLLYWEDGGGHNVIWEVENNEVIVRDCQTNQTIDAYDYIQYTWEVDYIRTDNLELSDNILMTVENRNKGW